ncbi:MAG TPA: hypothetical protein VM184_06290 [Gaiellaceae bacterium]|nr:hypothetical protein [Gaiellaceae bacterium]
MWFLRRRRRPPPPVLLPSLDRLAELVSRVVDLLDELVLKQHNPRSAPAERPVRVAAEELVLEQHKPSFADGWMAFVPSPGGYRLVGREGEPPGRGEAVEVEDAPFRVLRLGPSPLPGDRRRCAFLEREERSQPERTFDR